MTISRYTIARVSENSLLIQYEQAFGTELSVHIARCAEAITNAFAGEILNTIPSYNALLISFHAWTSGPEQKQIEEILNGISSTGNQLQRPIIKIPTYYNAEVANNLDEIITKINCTLEELIFWHTAHPFFVYMIGFCPGFGYMGDLPQTMHLPRRSVPQLKIPAGSVAIAEFQTAIYPIEMPGGWHVIGRTPVKVFDANRKQASLFKQGDLVQFYSITRDEYLKADGEL